MKILAIGGSNSSSSINLKLANYAASLFTSESTISYDLSSIDLPLFSVDIERTDGIHPIAIAFAEEIDRSDLIVISLAENNGSYNAAFKNLMDWTSRIKERKTWGNKDMLLMATSPGKRGGATVLEGATAYFPRLGATIVGTFSLPNFYENFSDEEGIQNVLLKKELVDLIGTLTD